MTDAAKICSTCNAEKPLTDFYIDRRTKAGYSGDCIPCQRERKAKYNTKETQKLSEKLITMGEAPEMSLDKQKRLEQAVSLRMEFYQKGALEALYDLAIMEMTSNSALMQVKYLAARALAGPMPGEGASKMPDGPIPDNWMKSLNDSYHATAPKLREIRERIATFTDGSEKTVN